uniref:Peroxisomal membrane protein PEX13 n=1 Tax=Panagrolaimus sp. PS1159 TaxID=55785 RepID=A0AC35F8D7_9BILA
MNFDGNNPPPLPPRPGQISNGIFDNGFGGSGLGGGGIGYGGYNQSFPMNNFGAGFGNNMYNQGGLYGGGGYGYGNFGGGGGYGMGNSAESNFVRIAEEQSRGAFQSIESVVNAVASVANMLSSTHNAVFSSFRAVIGVVEQFSLLKAQLGGFVFITLLKWLKWLWRTLLVHMGLKPKNYNSNDFIWDDINNQQQPQTALDYLPGTNQRRGFNWAAAIFWMIALGGPYLIYKAVSKMVANVEESRKWATGDREHYSAKALYDFNASSPQELSFRTNDILRVAPKSEQPQLRGWLLARFFVPAI